VTYPTQQSSSVTCPDGSPGPCAGAQWILPNWQSNVCNTSHTTQTLWTPPDCGAPPGENVVFKDANLKRCILSALPGQPSEITIQTAAKLLTVSCPGRGITDLTGLEKFANLNSLDLTGNQITQFALNLPNLQSLKISDNALISLDVSGLSPTRQVRLEAANNQLTAVVGLSTAYLIMVDLSHNKLASFDLPQQAASLTYADLSYNNLTNVLNQVSQNLNGMSYLQYLDLSSNSIPTVGSVATIAGGGSPTLQSLFLACNPTFACSSLGLAGGANPATALPRSACADYNAQDQQWIIRSTPFCPTEVQARRSARGRN
jgi:hypothetical protein